MINAQIAAINVDGLGDNTNLPSIAVIVRTHRLERLPLLRRAVFSICVQTRVRIELCIATQNFAPSDVETLVKALTPLLQGPNAIHEAFVLNVSSNQNSDLRAELLNAGISKTASRYLAFLDDDDLVYHYCYSQLIADADAAGAAVAFGRCVRVYGEQKGDIFFAQAKDRPYQGGSVLELIAENFCPIHSYIIDRNEVRAEDLLFDSISPFFEDYRFLLRLAVSYKFIFLSMNSDICEYWIYKSKINSTKQLSNRASVKSELYRQGYLATERLKSELSIQVRFLDLELWLKTRGSNRQKEWPVTDGLISHAHMILDDIRLSRDTIFGEDNWEDR